MTDQREAAIAAMAVILRADISDSAWNTDEELGEALDAAIAAMQPSVNVPDWEGFGRALLVNWPVGDIEGSELFELSLKYGMIREIPGGYDPDHHIDEYDMYLEKGDPWYEYTFGPHTSVEEKENQ